MSSTGVRETNSNEKRVIKGLIKNEEAFIQSLRVIANTSTLFGLGTAPGNSANAPQNASGSYLDKTGDFMIGQFGNNYDAIAATNLVDDTLDVSKSTGVTFPVVILQGEGLADDDLVTIIQGEDVFPFQELIIRTRVNTITVKNSDNVNTPDGNDLVLPPASIIHLYFDSFLGEWVIDGGTPFFGGGGGGGINFPIDFPITFLGTIGFITQIIDFSLSTRHGWKAEFNGDVELAFLFPPTGKLGLATFKFKQDGTGGHTLTLPAGTVNKDIVEAGFLLGAGEETGIVIEFFNDTFYAFLETGNIVTGGSAFSGNLSDLVIDVNENWLFQGISSIGDITGVTGITGTGPNVIISGIAEYDFFQIGQSFQNKADPDGGILYNVNDLQSHIFKADSVEIARFEESAIGVYRLNMLNHAVRDARDITFSNSSGAFVFAGSSPAIGYDSVDSRLIINHPTGATIFVTENATIGSTEITSGSVHSNILQANDVLQLGVDVTVPSVVGEMRQDGTDILVFSGGVVRNLSDIGTAVGANDTLSNLVSPTSVNQSLLPQASATLDLGSELLPWRIAHFREIEFPVDASVPTGVTHTQISKNASGNLAFNNAAAGGGYLYYFKGVPKWQMTPTSFTGDNIILQNSLTFNDSITNPVSDGEITRNGNKILLQTPEFAVRRVSAVPAEFTNLDIVKVDVSPSNDDLLGRLNFQIDDSGVIRTYAGIFAEIINTVDAGRMQFVVRADNVLIPALIIEGDDNVLRSQFIVGGAEGRMQPSPGVMAYFVTPQVEDFSLNVGTSGSLEPPRINDGNPSLNDLNLAGGAFNTSLFVHDVADGTLYVKNSNTQWDAYARTGTVT